MTATVFPFPEFGWVRGPYPVDVGETVPLTPHQESALRRRQAEAGIAVDGVMGPQSWVAISEGKP